MHRGNGNGSSRGLPEGIVRKGLVARQFERPNTDPAGLLLLDASLWPLYANEEAVSILCYPETPQVHGRWLSRLLVQRIDSVIQKQGDCSSRFCNGFASGKRHYHIRVFTLKRSLGNDRGPTLAVLFERRGRAPLDLSRITQKFHLTQRETEALQLLMRGYTTLRIARGMNISSNTAKVFLRSVMIKFGARHRLGILAKVLQISKG